MLNIIFQCYNLVDPETTTEDAVNDESIQEFRRGLVDLVKETTCQVAVLRSNRIRNGLSTSILIGEEVMGGIVEGFDALVGRLSLPYKRGPAYIPWPLPPCEDAPKLRESSALPPAETATSE